MAWWVALVPCALIIGIVVVARVTRRRAARRGWQRWNEQRRSGALAWTLFRRRPSLPRLTDRRDR